MRLFIAMVREKRVVTFANRNVPPPMIHVWSPAESPRLPTVSTRKPVFGTESETYDSDSVLTDVLEPDELQGAGTLTVDTLLLILSDDDVLQGSARPEDEDGIVVTALAIGASARSAVVPGPAGIKGLACSDLDRGTVGV
jgi:hypothetical protein